MIEPTINIEQVVREVLAELGVTPMAATCGCQKAENEKPKAEPGNGALTPNLDSPAPPPGDLVVNARVVTMTEVTGRLAGTRRLVVSRDAIVTPAVRDELIRRGINLSYSDGANGQEEGQSVCLAIVTTGTDFDPAALAAGLAREGLTVEHTSVDCLIAATEQLAAAVAKNNTLGVLLTRHTAAGLCLANRLQRVRAITGIDAPSVATAAAAVGANVLVADPLAGPFFQLRQLMAEFGRRGVRACPEPFRARLA